MELTVVMYKYLQAKNKIKVLNFHQVKIWFDTVGIYKTTTEKLYLANKKMCVCVCV